MSNEINKDADERLLIATQQFVADHKNPKVDIFKDLVENWGNEWSGIEPAYLGASDAVAKMQPYATSETKDIMSAFVKERHSRLWEQTYTKDDNAINGHMLNNYGYTEIIGKNGPYISERVRAGVGIYGQGVEYPAHQHEPEEIYIILAGSAYYTLGDQPEEKYTAGEVIHVPSMLTHGFAMHDEPVVLFYLWAGGDLREKSTFV